MLQNAGVFSTFDVEKPSLLVSLSNVEEQRKKVKIMQTKQIKLI
jgi:hypothetical protein